MWASTPKNIASAFNAYSELSYLFQKAGDTPLTIDQKTILRTHYGKLAAAVSLEGDDKALKEAIDDFFSALSIPQQRNLPIKFKDTMFTRIRQAQRVLGINIKVAAPAASLPAAAHDVTRKPPAQAKKKPSPPRDRAVEICREISQILMDVRTQETMSQYKRKHPDDWYLTGLEMANLRTLLSAFEEMTGIKPDDEEKSDAYRGRLEAFFAPRGPHPIAEGSNDFCVNTLITARGVINQHAAAQGLDTVFRLLGPEYFHFLSGIERNAPPQKKAEGIVAAIHSISQFLEQGGNPALLTLRMREFKVNDRLLGGYAYLRDKNHQDPLTLDRAIVDIGQTFIPSSMGKVYDAYVDARARLRVALAKTMRPAQHAPAVPSSPAGNEGPQG